MVQSTTLVVNNRTTVIGGNAGNATQYIFNVAKTTNLYRDSTSALYDTLQPGAQIATNDPSAGATNKAWMYCRAYRATSTGMWIALPNTENFWVDTQIGGANGGSQPATRNLV